MNNAFATEFETFSEELLSYLYRLSANKEDAKDLLHDTFIKANEHLNSFKGNSSLKTWVFAIATNLAKDNRRVKNRWPVDAQDTCKQATMSSTVNTQRITKAFTNQVEKRFELTEHINYCFTCFAKNLSLEKQIAVILKEIYEFKRNEIADILNVSEGVVKHLLHDGRKELQEKYHHRCAMINKTGVCYQCAELNDHFEGQKSAKQKISKLGMSVSKDAEANLDLRFNLIQRINPLKSNGAELEDTILQILREAIDER